MSAASLKVVAEDVIKETTSMLDNMGVEVLNVGVDGESLALATRLPNGCPGTLLSLAKFLLNKLQILSKNELIKLCAENSKIVLPGEADIIEENDGLDIEVIDDIELHLQNSIAEFTSSAKMNHFDIFTLEEVESWLSCNKEFSRERETNSRKLTKVDLKFACLKHILPKATKAWLMKNIGREGFRIFLQNQEILYVPKTVFMKSVRGFYRTITFDSAHLTNLLRESCAKNRLAKLGLKVQSLTNLSRGKDFEYLKKILSLKNQQSLEYDPMNQRCSEALFSLKTEEGLVKMKDYKGAKCCRLLRKGIIESLDTSGISAEERILNIYKLKIFLDDNINVIDRLSKPGTDSITNELWQMINVTLDSHITTYANLEHFNPRRKSTGGVEQFFSQVTLMCDGGSKLDCREISDILHRVMITNALRLTPISVKGFSFLANLGMHMTSYSGEACKEDNYESARYPKLTKRIDIHPKDSTFDRQQKKSKRIIPGDVKKKIESSPGHEPDGNVRKYHKKF